MTDQLTFDLYQTSSPTLDFKAWLLSFPPTPWSQEKPDERSA